MVIKATLAASAIAAAAMASSASAETVLLNFVGGTATPWGQVHIDVSPIVTNTNEYAVGLNMTSSSSLGNFVAWCLDLGHSISQGGPYSYDTTTTPFTNTFDLFAAGAMARVQSVFDASYASVITSNTDQAAGFQLALWEVLYDSNWTLATGAFQATANAGILGYANTYLTAGLAGGNAGAYDLTYLQSNATNPQLQNLVTASPSAVPLPAGGLLLLAALGGLGLARRRKTV